MLTFVAGLAVKPSQASQTPVVSLNPAKLTLANAYIGQTIQVNITISNVPDLWGWALQNVDFNPQVLNVTNVQEGPFLKSKDATFFLWASNSTLAFSKGDIPEINCALAADTTVSGSGVLATITFQVISAGTSSITIGEVALMSDIASTQMDENNEISCTWTNGTVTVPAVSLSTPSPSPTSPNQNSPPPSSNSGATAPSSPPLGNASVPDGPASNTYLYIGVIVIIVSAVLGTVLVVRRRK